MTGLDHDPRRVALTDEQVRRRRHRNIAVALTLLGLFVLFYLLTIFRMGGNIASRAF
jgi:hypothetical protein